MPSHLLHARRTRLAVACATLLLAACGGGDSDSPSGGGGGGATAPSVQVSQGFARPVAARTITRDGASLAVADRQVLIVLVEDVTPAQYDAVIARLGELGVQQVGQQLDMRMLVASTAADAEDGVIAAMAAMPGVAHADYNFAIETSRANPPQSLAEQTRRLVARLSGEQLRPQAISSQGRWWVDQIDLPAARAVEDAVGISAGPTIAVVDTGLPAGQNVLAESRVRRVDANGASLSDDSTADAERHGVAVAAFAAGSSADADGVSRHARVLTVDVYTDECSGFFSLFGCPAGLGRTFLTDVATGVRTAVLSDARIVNVSWGDTSKCSSARETRLKQRQVFRALQTPGVNLARRHDKLVVFSAGNNCEKADDQLLPSATDPSVDSWLSHALIVGASNAARSDALFSRMGQVVNLMAPGEQVSYGQAPMDGTSFAAPIVAGAAGVLQSIAPGLSAPETRFLLVDGAENTIRPAQAGAAGLGGYVGPDATTPTRLLNLGNSARAAELTRPATLRTLDTVSLAKGASTSVSFEVEIPATGVSAVDVVFVVDVSGSYDDDIAQMQAQATGIIDALTARGIDVQFGVTAFSDFPLAGYGGSSDYAFKRLTRITSDKNQVLAAIDALSIEYGDDEPESQLEALYQVATGAGRDVNGDGIIDPTQGDSAGQPMGFRPGAARVVIFATDASFHDSDTDPAYPGAGFTQTLAAMQRQGIRVIALQSGNTSGAASDIARLVSATGGAAYQLSRDSREVAEAIANGMDATFETVDVSLERIAGSEWITSVEQDKTRANAGEKVRFTVHLQGQRAASVDALTYDLYVWARANGSALLERVKIPVAVAP